MMPSEATGGWFHGGEGADPLRAAAERRRLLLSALLDRRRAEAETLQGRVRALQRQIAELEALRAELPAPLAAEPAIRREPPADAFWSPVPIVGFRLWRLTLLGVHGVVQAWPGPRFEARCSRGPGVPHDAPGCRCGIYAFKSPGALRAIHPGAGPVIVYGLVALGGKVVEHEHGYRARCAEVRAVAVLCNGALLCRSDPVWIDYLFTPGLGLAEAETAGGVRAIGPGLPVAGVEYLEDEARRFRESWT